jgi:hypothetical protein
MVSRLENVQSKRLNGFSKQKLVCINSRLPNLYVVAKKAKGSHYDAEQLNAYAMNDTAIIKYFADVGLNIVKGSAVATGFSVIFVAFIMSVFFILEGTVSPETNEQMKWCKEHHPTLSFSACSVEAGW